MIGRFDPGWEGASARSSTPTIQGAAADIIRRAMMRMPGALSQAGLSTRMLLQVHDELVFEAPKREAEGEAEAERTFH